MLLRRLFRTLLFACACVASAAAAQSCPSGASTTISGKVYAPNGTDPLPNVLVYIPTARVAPFAPGVSCPAKGVAPSGSPLVGAVTGVDGTFVLENVPVGSNIPLVIKLGRWRRQLVVPQTTACADTPFSTRLPRNQSEGDMPKIAIVSSATDQMECVVRAMGIDDAEFTAPGGKGSVNIYPGDSFPGAEAAPNSPTESALMGSAATLNQYDLLMLPSQSEYTTPTQSPTEVENLAQFVNAGGRAYLSHSERSYLDPMGFSPFENPTIYWWDHPPAMITPNPPDLPAAPANINLYLDEAAQMAAWLQATHVTSTLGQVPFANPTPQDIFSILSPIQQWLSNLSAGPYGGLLQVVAHTPDGSTNQCGRVVYDGFQIQPVAFSKAMPSPTFPSECKTGFQSPQESVLEWAFFELTPDQEASLQPASGDFGSEQIGLTTAPQTFTWLNNSAFNATAHASTTSPDFIILSDTCSSVPANGACQVQVAFRPTAVGYRSAYLNISSSGLLSNEKAYLSGIGTTDLTASANNVQFGDVPVGQSLTKSVTFTNGTSVAAALGPISTTKDYVAASQCGTAIAPGASCTVAVKFAPKTSGLQIGTLVTNTYNPIVLLGTGSAFTLALAPTSGSVEAGNAALLHATVSGEADYTGQITLACTTDAPASTCGSASISLGSNASQSTTLKLQTTSKYTVVGYGGFGASFLISVLGLFTNLGFSFVSRTKRQLVRSFLAIVIVASVALSLTACSSKYPDLNAAYTPAGTYTVTLSATDGSLTRTANYTLVVTR